jgi:hypothetical protein
MAPAWLKVAESLLPRVCMRSTVVSAIAITTASFPFSWCKAVSYHCHTYPVCFSLRANYRICVGPLGERLAGVALLLFHHTRTFLATRSGIEMEYLGKRGLSDDQTYVLNIVILIISILSTLEQDGLSSASL